MEWDRAPAAPLGGSVIQLDVIRDTTVRIEQHRPGELGDFTGAQPCFEGEQDNDAVTLRVPTAAHMPQGGNHLLPGEYLGLFACHVRRCRLSTLRPASRSSPAG